MSWCVGLVQGARGGLEDFRRIDLFVEDRGSIPCGGNLGLGRWDD